MVELTNARVWVLLGLLPYAKRVPAPQDTAPQGQGTASQGQGTAPQWQPTITVSITGVQASQPAVGVPITGAI